MNIRRLFAGADTSPSSDSAYTEPRSGLVFPMELGGLRRLAFGREYAEGDCAGHSIPYGRDDAQATIYVTTIAGAQFPDGGDNEFVRGEVERAMAAVREMERAGHYQPVKFFAAEPERLGTDPKNLIWARGAFFTTSDGRPMISFTYVTALRSRVIKLRITSSDPKSSALKEFPHALGDLISRQRSKPGYA